jgi:hypothetical protein
MEQSLLKAPFGNNAGGAFWYSLFICGFVEQSTIDKYF